MGSSAGCTSDHAVGQEGVVQGTDKKLRERPERRLWFRLAHALGCAVSELQARMSSHGFAEWISYSQIEEFVKRAV